MRRAAAAPVRALSGETAAARRKVTAMGLLRMKRLGEKICMVTAHDYPSAAHVGAAGVDVALCGDSLGMVALGYADTRPVTLDEMLHHCRAARRGLGAVGDAPLLVMDLPFGAYEESPAVALRAAHRAVKEGGADGVKVEGGSPRVAATVETLVDAGVAVMGHVGDETADRLIEKLVPRIEKLKVGPYTAGNDVDYGPVVTAAAKANIERLVQSGVDQGATLVVDGRNFRLQGYEQGYFVGPHLFDHATRDMDIYKQEIFGPVLTTVRAQSYEEAIGLAMDHEYGNGTAIFTRDGDAARDFANRINIGMVGVNVPIPVPLAYHTFGGWKKSVFGDLNQHGPDAFKFYTRTKTITARWPSGLKDGGEFHFRAMD